jgi:hypothetical protein
MAAAESSYGVISKTSADIFGHHISVSIISLRGIT